MRSPVIIAGLLLFLSACSPGKVYEKHVKMEHLAWNRFNTITFDVPIEDTGNGYDIFIAIRHITDIPYPDIDVYFYFSTPGGETRSRRINIPIKDKEGNNLGDGLGELWDVNYLAWKGFLFKEPGICKFEISSAMSQMDLVGVLEVGLIVRKSK
jgi:gliding motility-associated lipoprotein GldH